MSDEFEEFDRRIEVFLERVGFDRLNGVTGPGGVCADWDELRAIVSARLTPRLRPLHFDSYVLETGLVEAQWTWRRKSEEASIWIFVSGAGPVKVHQRLLSLATETTMVRIPYGPGPSGLGDLAVRHEVKGADSIRWAYRNVCVAVDGHGLDLDLEPLARVIQRFMESHQVARVAECLPRVDRVDKSASRVHVGDEWQLSLSLAGSQQTDSVLIEFEQQPVSGEYPLESVRSSRTGATYRAVSPGTARVEIQVVDRKTLLSPPLAATVEILPAR